MQKLIKLSVLSIIILSFVNCSKSPHETVSGQVAGAQIRIEYNSPSVRGRQIFGALVAYGKLWRAGANAATTFTTDKDITVEGGKLAAGTYALFVIPRESGNWTLIFNSDHDRSGATIEGLSPADYEEKNGATDVLQVSIKPVKTDTLREHLTFKISDTGFSLSWENVVLPVAIR
ncbi:DUF2911 domain-containing protein [Flavobacteriaceae bacterium F89]|uniref:DUF2911 domain-containing protein n=1 Tax=Cerina litoralis TaxID=2874477 RepID=A0AAE3JS71_9FLAO|nr:DUF2911 domain-containing protein [Cerina litoralis]MCG2462148.1 DUF2911 domain-containing protein [Cerina litoralis]